MIASTPSRRHSSTSAGSSTVHTCTAPPDRCTRSTYLGCARTTSILGPDDLHVRRQRAVPQPQRHPLEQLHGRDARCQRAHPAQRHPREAHDPHRHAVPQPRVGPAEPVQRLHQPALDQTGVPGGVLGLDRHLHRAAAVAHVRQQRVQGQHPAVHLDVRLVQDRGVGGCGLVAPGGEVQLRQVGVLQRRDRPVAVRGAVDPAVVHAHGDTVCGQPDVALQRVRAHLDRPPVRCERVLSPVGGRAPVSHHGHHGTTA